MRVSLIISVIGLTFCLAELCNAGWTNSTICQNEMLYSVAVDSSCNPHIVYAEYAGDGSVYYMSMGERTWSREKIYQIQGNSIYFGLVHLFYDSHNEPQVYFMLGSTIMYAYRQGGIWTVDPVPIGQVTTYTIALNSHDHAGIYYKTGFTGCDLPPSYEPAILRQ